MSELARSVQFDFCLSSANAAIPEPAINDILGNSIYVADNGNGIVAPIHGNFPWNW